MNSEAKLKATPILAPDNLHAETLERLGEIFDVRRMEGRSADGLSAADREAVRGMAIMGRVPAELMRALPNLEIVAHFGVGYDGVDVEHAVSDRIMVTNTPHVLDDEVADTAVALILNTLRELPQAEHYLRAGRWESEGPYPLTRGTLRGRTAGIMGLGRIGLAIARRLEAFGVPIAYHNRNRRNDVSYAYHGDLLSLARAVDLLIVAAPSGQSTDKAVGRAVLEALGPDGVLVNIGRGSIVDEEALADALEDGTILAAGLDVFADEPHVPERLMKRPNAVLLPHVASASLATRRAMGQLVIDNLVAWFEGRDVLTPVVETVQAGMASRRG